MGVKVEEELNDWLWTFQEEPHKTRRKAIMKAHPEVTKLCGPEPLTKYVVSVVVLIQFLTAYYLKNTNFWSFKFWVLTYLIGATSNQNLFMAIHELSHNLAFKTPLHNKLFSIWANLPVGIPYSASFKPYHQLHHKYLGDTKLDADLPTKFEALVLSNVLGKAFFSTCQIFFYALRPMFVATVKITPVHLLNIVVQLIFDFIIVKFWGWYSMLYFLLSSFLAGSLHPLAGHFIAEHYVLNPPDPSDLDKNGIPPPETYSYYGCLNIFVYNVGLHNEHHDFPYIPWTRLWRLNEIACEFYDPLPKYYCWTKVIFEFITKGDVNLWCRVRRDGHVKEKASEIVIEDGI